MIAETRQLGLPVVFLTVVFLSACSRTPESLLETTDMPASPIPVAAPTPTVVGTWETTIDGFIYDKSFGSERPVAGAVIHYAVRHTYFPELQIGRAHTALTDKRGLFALPVVVHDTDRIVITAEAQGYLPYELSLVGIDLVAGGTYDIGLIRQSDK